MSIEENKTIVPPSHRGDVQSGQSRGRGRAHAPDFVDHAAPSGRPTALRAIRPRWPDSGTPFRICEVTVTEEIGEEERPRRSRLTMRGTQTREIFSASRQRAGRSRSSGIHIVRFAGGKIVEAWGSTTTSASFSSSVPSRYPRQSERKSSRPAPEPGDDRETVGLTRREQGCHPSPDRRDSGTRVRLRSSTRSSRPITSTTTRRPARSPDREGFRQFAGALRTALPDMHSTVDDLVAEETRWHGGTACRQRTPGRCLGSRPPASRSR